MFRSGNGKPVKFLVRFYSGNQKSDQNWIHSTICMVACRAYAVAPYTGILKNGDFSIHPTTGVAVRGAYAIRPYTDRQKPGRVLVHFYSGNQKSDRN